VEDKAARRGTEQVIPDEIQAIKLHEKYGSKDGIIKHCITVCKVAMIIAEEFVKRDKKIKTEVVRAASLLHDIGRSQDQTVRHGVVGAEILEREGVDNEVVEAVRRHVGAGLTREEARKLGLPDGDYIPRTLEELIVCFADKMVDSDRVRPFDIEVKRFEREGHDKIRLISLKEKLKEELGVDPETIVMEKLGR
jgi:uncharacterized protein (TIGR00295 family)